MSAGNNGNIKTGQSLAAGEAMEAVDDPFALFRSWFALAEKKEVNDPNAMALSTVDAGGLPNARMVLLKDVDGSDAKAHRGFVFYTNLESAKGRELDASGKAAVLFHWKSLRRQVRVRGLIRQVSDEEADAYFASRPRASRIGAWASDQSRELESRFVLEQKVASLTAKFGIGAIPRPAHWSGFRLLPTEIEFWCDRMFRLHDRLVYRRKNPDDPWRIVRLYP